MRSHLSVPRSIAIAIIMVCFAFTTPCLAGEVTLAWDPHDNTHSNLSGYNLYYKAGSSVQSNPDGATLIYIALTDPGFDPDQPSFTVTELLDDTEYFFAVTAMVEDDESGMSNEVSAMNGSALDSNNGTASSGSGDGGGTRKIRELKIIISNSYTSN